MRKASIDPSSEDYETEDDSKTWTGVSFACVPPKRAKQGRAARKLEPRYFFFTRRMAFRFEALIRVAEAPERYAARMARALHAQPKLAVRILQPPNPIGSRYYPRLDVADVQDHARRVIDTG